MKNPVYMVHQINDEIKYKLDILDAAATITLDDGLLTQYIYKEALKKFKRVIFFVNPTILCDDNIEQDHTYIPCKDAHRRAFNGYFQNYMKLSQLLELQEISNFEIGSHFQNHIYFKNINEMLDNANKSLHFFSQNNIKINSFCFPYNQDRLNVLFKKSLKLKYPDFDIYGNERIPIENI